MFRLKYSIIIFLIHIHILKKYLNLKKVMLILIFKFAKR